MVMSYLESELRKTGDPEDANLADHTAARLSARGQDIDLPQGAQVAPQATPKIEVAPRTEIKSPLEQVIAEYKTKKPHTAELITLLNRILWAQLSEISGIDIVAPVVAESQRDIEAKENRGKGIIFVPEGFAEQSQRPLIAAAFKLINNEYVPSHWSMQADNPVKNDKIHIGYRWMDMQIEAPNLRTNEQQARDLTRKGEPEEEAEGMNLSEYALAGFYSKLLTGKYLDEPTWSRLLSSSRDGQVVSADFLPHGFFFVDSPLGPEDRVGVLGARFSSGVKTA